MPGLSGLEVARRIDGDGARGPRHRLSATMRWPRSTPARSTTSLKPVDAATARRAPSRSCSKARGAGGPARRGADRHDALLRPSRRGRARRARAARRSRPASAGRCGRFRCDDVACLRDRTRGYTRVVHEAGEALIRTPLKELLARLSPQRVLAGAPPLSSSASEHVAERAAHRRRQHASSRLRRAARAPSGFTTFPEPASGAVAAHARHPRRLCPASTSFYRHAELTRLLFDYAAARPDLVAVRSIGKSYEGRDIWVATLTNSAHRRRHRQAGLLGRRQHPRRRADRQHRLPVLAAPAGQPLRRQRRGRPPGHAAARHAHRLHRARASTPTAPSWRWPTGRATSARRRGPIRSTRSRSTA